MRPNQEAFFVIEETINKTKRQSTGENIFHTTTKKKNQPNQKMGRRPIDISPKKTYRWSRGT